MLMMILKVIDNLPELYCTEIKVVLKIFLYNSLKDKL